MVEMLSAGSHLKHLLVLRAHTVSAARELTGLSLAYD
jgi:hypothetical protein